MELRGDMPGLKRQNAWKEVEATKSCEKAENVADDTEIRCLGRSKSNINE